MINHPVTTPIGKGTFQGVMPTIRQGTKHYLVMVRMPINTETEKHLQDSNCLTRRATASGLWLFETEEIKAAK